MTTVMDGKALAAKIKLEIKVQVDGLSRKPGLAVIIVGDNPASRTYVNSKKKDCEECGIYSEEYALSAETPEEELLTLIDNLNKNENIDGILCQLPLPDGFDKQKVLLAIDPGKDVDGFHPISVGRLALEQDTFSPCTPAGIMELLKEYGVDPKGKECVVVGRSNIVGKPTAMKLMAADGTVTSCNSMTQDLAGICRRADILVSAAGVVNLITADMVKEGAVVIDVAMNRNTQGKLCGDVDFAHVAEKTSFITPVPGGVGPMTRAMLMANTLKSAQMK